jgi:hypothetical protein
VAASRYDESLAALVLEIARILHAKRTIPYYKAYIGRH